MAQPFGIKLAVEIDQKDLVKAIKEAIDKINTEGKLVGKGLKLPVDTNALTHNIKKAIQEINESNKLDSKPINLSVSAAKLRESIKSAVNQINSSRKLDGTTVKLSAGIDLKSTAKNLQQQIAELTKQSSNVNLGATNGTQLQTAIANVRKELEAEGKKLQENNEFLRERVTLFTQSGNVATSRKYGASGKNTVVNTYNGRITSVSNVTDNSKIEAEQIKATAAINKTRNALAALKAEYSDINATKPIKNTENFAQLEKEYEKIIELINEFEKSDNKNTAQFKANVESKITSFEQLIDKFQRAEYAPNTLRAKDVGTSKSIESNRLDEFIAKVKASNVPITEMQDTIDRLNLSLENIKDAGSLTKFLNEFSIAKSEFSALKAESKSLSTEINTVSKTMNDLKSSFGALEKITKKPIFANNMGDEKVAALVNNVKELKKSYADLITSLGKDSSAENVARVREQMTQLQVDTEKATSSATALETSLKRIGTDGNITRRLEELQARIVEFKSKNITGLGKVNSYTGKTFGAELDELLNKIPIAQAKGLEFTKSLENGFRVVRSQMQSLGATGKTILQDLYDKGVKFIKWTAMTLAITKARMYFRQLFTTVLQLDESITDLRKTFKGSAEELNDFYSEANKLAKQMGVTTDEIIKQGAAWSRMNYNTNEAMQTMAKMSSMFAAISPDLEVDEATNGLISIIKAFNIDPNNVLDGILSKINIIGNTAATSNGEIVEMLKRSSAAMKVANNTLEETIALELASIEITRDAPGTGVAWRTISSRLRGIDEETLEVIEDIDILTGKIADATKTANNPGGISIFTDASRNTYKSTYQIIKEIAEIWYDLTDRQTAELGEIMGGKRNLQVVSAAIENFKAAEQALDNMAHSAGNAEAEMEIIRDGAAYALNELKETFTSLAQHAIERDDLKDLIKAGTSLLEIVDGIVSKIGLIPAILTTIIGITASKKFTKGGLFGLATNEKTGKMGLTLLGSHLNSDWWGNVTGKTQRLEIENDIKAVQNFHNALKNGNMTMQTYNAVMKNSNTEIKRYGRAALQAGNDTTVYRKTVKNLNTQLKQTGTSGKIAAVGLKAAQIGVQMLNTAISMGISLLVSWGLNKLIEGIDNAVHAVDNLTESAKENTETAKSLKSDIESLNNELQTTKERLHELDQIKLKRSLTLFEEDEYETLKKYNDELERSIKLETAKLELTLRQANNEAKDAIKKKQTSWSIKIADMEDAEFSNGNSALSELRLYLRDIEKVKLSEKDFGSLAFSDIKDSKIAIEAYISLYESMLGRLKELENEQSGLSGKELVKKGEEIKDYQDKLDLMKSVLMENIIDVRDWQASLNPDDPTNKEILEYLDEIIQRYETLMGINPKTPTEIYESAKYTAVRKELEALAKAGELTAEKFEELTDRDIAGIEEFKKELESIPDANAEEVVRSIIQKLEDLEDEADAASRSVKTFQESLGGLAETLDDVIAKQEKLADAFQKMASNAKLSAKEIYELMEEIPEIYKYLEYSNGGYTISPEGIAEINQKFVDEMHENIQGNANKAKKNLDDISKLYEMAQKLNKELNPSEEDLKEYQKLYRQTKNIRDAYGITSSDSLESGLLNWRIEDEFESAIQALQEEVDGYEFLTGIAAEVFDKRKIAIDGIQEGFSNAKTQISDYNNDIKTIDNAIKTLKEDSLLTYDEMNDLIEIAPELQSSFVEDKGRKGYSITIDALEELRKTSFEARDAYINDRIAETEANIKSARDQKRFLRKKQGILMSMPSLQQKCCRALKVN